MNTTTTGGFGWEKANAQHVAKHGQVTIKIDLRELDDQRLLELVLAKSDAAWGELVRRFQRPVRGTLFSVLKRYATILDGDARDELMQDFYLRILEEDMRRLRMYSAERGRLVSFLRRIVRNMALDLARKLMNRPSSIDIDELLLEENTAPEEEATGEGFAPDRRRHEIVDAHLWWLERQAQRKAERNARGIR